MAKANSGAGDPRPLSPHLQVYRWPVTMLTSILHRVSGVGLYTGSIFLAVWLAAAAAGPAAYSGVMALYTSPFGILILAGYSWALLYHMLNGVRHVFWDFGKGFEKAQANASSYAVLIGSLVLTGGLWALALSS